MKRFLTQTSGGLIALLIFIVAATFPGIPIGEAQEREHVVSVDEATVHAAVAMAEGVVTDIPSVIRGQEAMEPWRGCILGEPLLLYDLNREPLVYSFPVALTNGQMLGRIWISANKILGLTVCSYLMGPRTWYVEEARARAERTASEMYPQWNIDASFPVIYSFPKVGLLVILSHPRSQEVAQFVIDIADFTLVPEASTPDVRGIGMWSLYESINPREWSERIERWQEENRWANRINDQLRERADLDLRVLTRRPLVVESWLLVQELFQALTTCQTCIVPGGIPAPSGINQFCQQTNYYCTVATGQMIAAFYGIQHTQNHIASVMGTTTSGTSTSGELVYFRDATQGLGRACSDYDRTTSDWNEFASEICAGRPFDTSLTNHSRTAAGVRTCQTASSTTRFIGLVDPWPPNQGCGERWDNWSVVTLFEHVWARNCP